MVSFFPDMRLTKLGKNIKYCAAVSKPKNMNSYNNIQHIN